MMLSTRSASGIAQASLTAEDLSRLKVSLWVREHPVVLSVH